MAEQVWAERATEQQDSQDGPGDLHDAGAGARVRWAASGAGLGDLKLQPPAGV